MRNKRTSAIYQLNSVGNSDGKSTDFFFNSVQPVLFGFGLFTSLFAQGRRIKDKSAEHKIIIPQPTGCLGGA